MKLYAEKKKDLQKSVLMSSADWKKKGMKEKSRSDRGSSLGYLLRRRMRFNLKKAKLN